MNDVQRIRMHPAPLFGELGNYGVLTAVKRVVAYFLPYCENISLSVSDDSIITIKCNIGTIDIVRRGYFINSLEVDSIKDSFGDWNEFFIFSATCESLQVNSHLDRGILTVESTKMVSSFKVHINSWMIVQSIL